MELWLPGGGGRGRGDRFFVQTDGGSGVEHVTALLLVAAFRMHGSSRANACNINMGGVGRVNNCQGLVLLYAAIRLFFLSVYSPCGGGESKMGGYTTFPYGLVR